ncbi:MAG: hypothetical protein A3H96_20565 [Acidobacteria bacterium RIFCSPLOWO2_02_FULL_67_36]|nr:MAG: hypothetical protein A3H96_20565 [Acidobacteria bacterium RIFCSPLOWO2_02_FULL_67_36]OFW24596.1 MAG: hypothetical protein A3G21_18775 [Acidobacteria bacterium RIFCSPLOWO2_12_FULL_66_21]
MHFVGSALIALLCSPPLLAQVKVEPLTSFAQLGLKVARTEVVDEISNRQGTFKPGKDGVRLLLVTLEGTARAPAHLTYRTDDFTLVYKMKVAGGTFMSASETYWSASSVAVKWGAKDDWSITTLGFLRGDINVPAGPVLIVLAFEMVSDDIAGAYVTYPALAAGLVSATGATKR